MPFVSQLVGLPVVNPDGDRLGTLRDLVVRLEEPEYPSVTGLVVRADRRDYFVAIADAAELADDRVRLARASLSDQEFARRDGEVLLEGDVLDRQLIDVRRARVIRANDAVVDLVGGHWRLVGIDVGVSGIVRRLGPRRLVRGLRGELIDWAVIEPLATTVPEVRLEISHDKLAKLHPSDIARIVDTLAYPQGAEIMRSLDDETAADTLEEVEEKHQVDILEDLPVDRAADILEEMAPDAAADVLEEFAPERAEALIDEMDRDESMEVKLLLSYPPDSAGGLMTTDYIVAMEGETTRHATETIRAQLEDPDLVYYVYVVDHPDRQRLLGVVSLRDLLLAEPDQPLRDYMRRDVKSTRPEEKAVEAARLMTEYNLLALPVTTEAGQMLGVVTADDALELLLPESMKRHVPRLFS